MNTHALSVIEFPGALALVAERAATPLGAARVRALAPTPDRTSLDAEHERVAAMRALVAGESGWTVEPIPELEPALARLRIDGAAWSGADFVGGRTLLRSARQTRDALRDARRPAVATAVLAPIAQRLVSAPAEEKRIERAIDDDGSVKDDASHVLRRVRRELRGAEGELVKLLERFMARLDSHQQVPDMSVTVRNGRYVIPVRREARSSIGGIVHDTSASGATLFVEPPAAVEAGNRIRELESEELREIDRILRELTELLRPLREPMVEALDALTQLDALFARARFAIEFSCAPIELCASSDGFAIREGRHPLLLAQHGEVVPFDLTMLPDERTLLVSGPNTGGKTVLLKALGLLSALSQAGVPVPVGPESRIAVFDDIFADVGDEQSIQASLSTFSAHLRNLAEILQRATQHSLVLVDELGSGTDPVEGAALGAAILEELTTRHTLTVATTHLGALKELAIEVPGVVNASLQFDAVALAPTYRLLKGVPGRSYGLSIARRLRLPEDVLARAEARVPRGERDVNALLAELEAREAALAERERDADELAEDSRTRAHRIAEREGRVRERERELDRAARSDARRHLLDARAEIERTIADLKSAGSDAQTLADAARAARRRVESLADAHGEALSALDDEEREERNLAPAGAPGAVVEGDAVLLGTLGGREGLVVELRDSEAVVAVGAVKLTVPLATLSRSRSGSVRATAVLPMLGDVPDVEVRTELDLRGSRVGEIDDALMQALDSAIRADLRMLRIIHGKGTGALRERVAAMLRKDTRVVSFRLGAWNEGGAGVTIAEFA